MFRSIMNTVKAYGIYDIEVRRIIPTKLGRKFGYTEKTLIVVVGSHYGTNWQFSESANEGMQVGKTYYVGIGGYIGLQFTLNADGNVTQELTLPDMAVFGVEGTITFQPKVDITMKPQLAKA